MTKVHVDDSTLTISFTAAERIAGLIRNQSIPLSAVRDVEVVPDGLAAARGIRAPGLALPGRRKVGTWRSRSGKTLVAVRGQGPAVRLTLSGHPYAAVLLTTESPEELATSLAERVR